MDLDELIRAYWQHYELAKSSERADRLRADDYFWAWELVEDVAGGRTPHIDLEVDPIELMTRLADHAPDERALSYLGAGPVEEYLRGDAPDLDAVDEAARRNAGFRTALRGAWFDDDLPPSDAQRLRRFGRPD